MVQRFFKSAAQNSREFDFQQVPLIRRMRCFMDGDNNGLLRCDTVQSGKRVLIFYVQVTVHRDKIRKNNQLDASISKIYFVIKPYMFRVSSVPIIRGYPLYTRQLVRFMQVM